MNTTEKLEILCGFNEKQLSDNVVIPLLEKMGLDMMGHGTQSAFFRK